MSDLHRAVLDDVEHFRPLRTPPFAVVRARRTRRTRRRIAAGAALAVATALPIGLLAPGSGGLDRLPVAGGGALGTATTAPQPDATPRKALSLAHPPDAEQARETKDGLRACTDLPGVEDVRPAVRSRTPEPLELTVVTVAGAAQIEAFTACVSAVPEVYVQQTVTTPTVDFEGLPGHPEDVSFVEICSSADGHECRSLSRDVDPGRDRALALARAFATARRTPTQSTVCRTGNADELTVRFRSPAAESALITVRVGCPAVWLGRTRYAVSTRTAAAVRAAFEEPPWAAVADLVTQCVGHDRPQPVAELVGLASLRALQRVREQGLRVRTLGSGSGCRTASTQPYDEGRMTLVVSDADVVLWAGPG